MVSIHVAYGNRLKVRMLSSNLTMSTPFSRVLIFLSTRCESITYSLKIKKVPGLKYRETLFFIYLSSMTIRNAEIRSKTMRVAGVILLLLSSRCVSASWKQEHAVSGLPTHDGAELTSYAGLVTVRRDYVHNIEVHLLLSA